MRRMILGKQIHAEADGRIVYEHISSPEIIRVISNWKHNRPPDMLRVREIQSYIEETGLCDGELLLAVIQTEDGVGGGCVCYDGNHRLQACKSVFPRNGVRVRIITRASEDDIRREFHRINKGVPVPDLYFSEEEVDKVLLRDVTACVNQLSSFENVAQHISASRKPCRPNFNRDSLVEQICSFLKETQSRDDIMTRLTPDHLQGWFQDLNIHIRDKILPTKPDSGSERIVGKCKRTGWYVFMDDWRKFFKDVPLF